MYCQLTHFRWKVWTSFNFPRKGDLFLLMTDDQCTNTQPCTVTKSPFNCEALSCPPIKLKWTQDTIISILLTLYNKWTNLRTMFKGFVDAVSTVGIKSMSITVRNRAAEHIVTSNPWCENSSAGQHLASRKCPTHMYFSIIIVTCCCLGIVTCCCCCLGIVTCCCLGIVTCCCCCLGIATCCLGIVTCCCCLGIVTCCCCCLGIVCIDDLSHNRNPQSICNATSQECYISRIMVEMRPVVMRGCFKPTDLDPVCDTHPPLVVMSCCSENLCNNVSEPEHIKDVANGPSTERAEVPILTTSIPSDGKEVVV